MTTSASESAPSLRFEFTITEDDLLDGSHAYYGIQRTWNVAIGLAVAIVGVIALVVVREPWPLFAVGGGVLVVAMNSIRPVERLWVRSWPNARIGTTCVLEFLPSGIRFNNAGLAGEVDWSAITEVREGDGAMMLLSGRAPMVNIPKRVFDTPAELQATKEYVDSKVTPRPTRSPGLPWALLGVVAGVFVAGLVWGLLRGTGG